MVPYMRTDVGVNRNETRDTVRRCEEDWVKALIEIWHIYGWIFLVRHFGQRPPLARAFGLSR